MKTSRQKVLDIFNRKNTDDKAFGPVIPMMHHHPHFRQGMEYRTDP